MASFKNGVGDWTEYRKLKPQIEINFHVDKDDYGLGSHWENMKDAHDGSLKALIRAQNEGLKYVLFIHGWSTSRIGKTTARSQVRKLMRSAASTPYIIRSECIQHNSVFVAAIRPKGKD